MMNGEEKVKGRKETKTPKIFSFSFFSLFFFF